MARMSLNGTNAVELMSRYERIRMRFWIWKHRCRESKEEVFLQAFPFIIIIMNSVGLGP
jgi:hypothetical protein